MNLVFFKFTKKEKNICFQSRFREAMLYSRAYLRGESLVNGLNSGILLIIFKGKNQVMARGTDIF